MSRAPWGILYYTLRYGSLIAGVVIGVDLLAMVFRASWQGIDTQLLLVASYGLAFLIGIVRVARAVSTDT